MGECDLCGDSGYREFASGGIWTGENITIRREFCDCPCGQDARDQEAGVGLHAIDPDQAYWGSRDAEFDDRWNARMNP